jgi:hypothetical protein
MNLLEWINTDPFATYRDKFNAVVQGLKEGVSGQVLVSAGPGNNPVWTTQLVWTTINIGDWNMSSDRYVFVDISTAVSSRSKIRSIQAFIRPDDDAGYNKLLPIDVVQNAIFGDFTGGEAKPQGGIDFASIDAGSTNIVLSREDGGYWASSSFNATSYNRGYIVIGHTL